jgi:hypothetical protein
MQRWWGAGKCHGGFAEGDIRAGHLMACGSLVAGGIGSATGALLLLCTRAAAEGCVGVCGAGGSIGLVCTWARPEASLKCMPVFGQAALRKPGVLQVVWVYVCVCACALPLCARPCVMCRALPLGLQVRCGPSGGQAQALLSRLVLCCFIVNLFQLVSSPVLTVAANEKRMPSERGVCMCIACVFVLYVCARLWAGLSLVPSTLLAERPVQGHWASPRILGTWHACV